MAAICLHLNVLKPTTNSISEPGSILQYFACKYFRSHTFPIRYPNQPINQHATAPTALRDNW